MSRWVRSFSRPSGISDWPEAANSSMSRRKHDIFLAFLATRASPQLAVSLAMMPDSRRPSTVATVKLP